MTSDRDLEVHMMLVDKFSSARVEKNSPQLMIRRLIPYKSIYYIVSCQNYQQELKQSAINMNLKIINYGFMRNAVIRSLERFSSALIRILHTLHGKKIVQKSIYHINTIVLLGSGLENVSLVYVNGAMIHFFIMQ